MSSDFMESIIYFVSGIINVTNCGFCQLLHSGLNLEFDAHGEIVVSPCDESKRDQDIKASKNAFMTPELVQAREDSLQTRTLPPACVKCVQAEEHGKNSDRLKWNHYYKTWPDDYQRNIDKVLDVVKFKGPLHMTIRPSVVCNLACVVCSPALSTLWRKQSQEKLLEATEMKAERLVEVLQHMDLTNLRTVHLYGGETLLTPLNNIILEQLQPYADKITIWYDTNGTVQPTPRTLDLWKNFKTVMLKFSIDAAGDAYEYLRWPGKWSKVQENIKFFEPIQNAKIFLRPTHGFLNLHTLNDLNKWAAEHFDYYTEYYGTFGHFAINYITPEMLQDFKDSTPDDHRAHEILPEHGSYDHVQDIKNRLQELDTKRGTSWKKSLPHLKKYLGS